jgi:hypothetical protein
VLRRRPPCGRSSAPTPGFARGPDAHCCRSSVVEHSLGKGEVESSIPSGSTIFPKLARRTKLITQLEQQRELAKDEGYVVKRQKWVKGEDGVKQQCRRRRCACRS